MRTKTAPTPLLGTSHHHPRYSAAEAARWLAMPDSTLRRWMTEQARSAQHPDGLDLIASTRTEWCPRALSFVSLVAAHNIRVMLSHPSPEMGWPLVRATAARCVDADDPCGLASRQFGTRIGIWPFMDNWAVPSGCDWTGEVFGVEYAASGEPVALKLPTGHTRYVMRVNPEINFGEPSFISGAAPLSAVRSRYLAGESVEDLAADYGTSADHIAAAFRVHYEDRRHTGAGLDLGRWPLTPPALLSDAATATTAI